MSVMLCYVKKEFTNKSCSKILHIYGKPFIHRNIQQTTEREREYVIIIASMVFIKKEYFFSSFYKKNDILIHIEFSYTFLIS